MMPANLIYLNLNHSLLFYIRSKPRLSVHERQKQRLAATTTPVIPIDSNILKSNETNSNISQ